MFSQVTRKIYGMENDISATSARIAQCENDIYHIREDMYDGSRLWEKINKSEYELEALSSTIVTLGANAEAATRAIQDLMSRIQHLEDAIGANPDAKPENPKQKIDLEILEEKGEFEVDPFITPEYYLYNEDNWRI